MCRNCYHCGYYKENDSQDTYSAGYCADLDCAVDPDEPICSDEYYNS